MIHIQARVYDTEKKAPAEGVFVKISKRANGKWEEMGAKFTGRDGLTGELLIKFEGNPEGLYQLRFETGAYFRREKRPGFFTHADVHFEKTDAPQSIQLELSSEHYQVRGIARVH